MAKELTCEYSSPMRPLVIRFLFLVAPPSPLMWSTRPSSTSTLTSSFLSPGRSALKTWASGVSFQPMQALENAEVLRPELWTLATELEKGKSSKGSQISKDNGLKTFLCWLPKKLRIRDVL
ncbi:unnamed protein product [Fraxinus pennsylvanica]|uniref:Uncharacterized protein n=1 Tax=Fraxinus pennsylvanica TaxID=56036 RepID=A0AAD1ZNJ7_9LAMI|nr:unnamed protein product [Fraxinus pennsylvanica]